MFGIFRPIMKHYFYWNHNKLYREAMVNNRTVELTATGFCRRMWEWWRNESGSASWRIVFLKNGEQPDFFISFIKDFVFSVRLLAELCKNVTWLAVHRQNPLHFRGNTLLFIFVNTATLAFGLNGRDAMHFKIQYIIIKWNSDKTLPKVKPQWPHVTVNIHSCQLSSWVANTRCCLTFEEKNAEA